MKKILKVFGICALSLTLITSVFGCKKSSTTKKPTTSNTTSDTKITTTPIINQTTAKPTTTVKPTTTKRTVVLDPKERKTIHITDYDNVTIRAYDDEKNYSNGDTFEINSRLYFSCKNENSYPVCVSFYGNDDVLIKNVNVFENDTKIVSLESNSDVYVKTSKLEIDTDKAFINIDGDCLMKYDLTCSMLVEGSKVDYYATNGDQLPKDSLIKFSIQNTGYSPFIVTIKVGGNIVDEFSLNANRMDTRENIVLSDNLNISVRKSDMVDIYIIDNYNCGITAYYYDEDQQKIEKDDDFSVERGTTIYFAANPSNEKDAVCVIRYDEKYDDYLSRTNIMHGDTTEISLNNGVGIEATESLWLNTYPLDYNSVTFTSEVDGISLEIVDFDTQEVIDFGEKNVSKYSKVRFIYTNNTNKDAIISYVSWYTEGFLLKGQKVYYDMVITDNLNIVVKEYKEYKVEFEVPDDENLETLFYYKDYNGAKYKVISGNNYPCDANIYFDLKNNTKKKAVLKAYNVATGESIYDHTVSPGSIFSFIGTTFTLKYDLRFVVELGSEEISYNSIKVEKPDSISITIYNGIDEYGAHGDCQAIHNGYISMELKTSKGSIYKYTITDSSNNIVKEAYFGSIVENMYLDIEKKVENILVSSDLKITFTLVEEEVKHRVAVENQNFIHFELENLDTNSEYDEGMFYDEEFDNDTKIMFKFKNTADYRIQLEIEYEFDSKEIILLSNGEEFERTLFVDQEITFRIEEYYDYD